MKNNCFTSSLVFLAACMLLLPACKQEDVVSEEIIFHVQVSEVKDFSAMVTVTHNATNRDIYYCFAVEGEVSDVQTEIDRFIASTPASQLPIYEHSQRKCYFRYNRLFPEKTYTVIAFGMNDNKHFYGTPSTTTFTTLKSDLVATENPNWKIEYKGYVLYDNKDWSLVTVSVVGDVEERFFLSTLTADEAEAFRSTEELIVYSAWSLLDEKETDTDVDYWLEDSSVRTGGTNFYRYLTEGDYVSYAVGINADGSPTGHYVKTPVYHVDKYPADEMYAHLLGEWVVTDVDGRETNVTFTEYTVNKSLRMSGWGGLKKQSVFVTYNRSDGSMTIDVQVVNDNITISFDSGKRTGKLTLIGGYYNDEGKLKRTTSITSLTTAKRKDNGDYTFETNYHLSHDDGTTSDDVGMMYMITEQDGTNSFFGLRMFPFTMQKK